MIEIIKRQFENVKRRYKRAILEERNLIIPDFILTENLYNKQKIRLLIEFPRGFPVAKPENFFVDYDLRFAKGWSLDHSYGVCDKGGFKMTKVFIHPTIWDANRDTLYTFLMVCKRRLEKEF